MIGICNEPSSFFLFSHRSYMCQINTEPMMSQKGYLDVLGLFGCCCCYRHVSFILHACHDVFFLLLNVFVLCFLTFFLFLFPVPPTIIEEETSSDVVVEERGRVGLRCRANGYPTPTVTWRREDGKELNLGSQGGKKQVAHKFEGEYLNISQVSRDDMGAYLCIITNSVPPSISKRIFVQVNCKCCHLKMFHSLTTSSIEGQESITFLARGTEKYIQMSCKT